MTTHEQWHEIAKETGRVSLANGFAKPTWDGLPAKVMFGVGELDEAQTSTCDPFADPLGEELADAAIRIMDVLETLWEGGWTPRHYMTTGQIPPPIAFQPIEVLLWRPLKCLCQAVECWRHEKDDDVRLNLEMAVDRICELSIALEIDLYAEIQKKVEKNRGRGHLHGKARSEG